MPHARSGLRKAIGTVFHRASRQRCRLHCMRNVLEVGPKGSQDKAASHADSFAQPDAEHIQRQFIEVAVMLPPKKARSHA
jgi:putative transposase